MNDGSIITTQGQSLISSLIAGNSALSITRAAVGNGTPPTDPTSLTGLVNHVQNAVINSIAVNNGNTVVSVSMSSDNVTTGYYIKEIGLFATPTSGSEVLAVYVSLVTHPVWIRPSGEAVNSISTFDIAFVVSSELSVTATVDPSALATKEDIADIMGYIGYADADIYGVEVDYENNRITRLAGAVGLTAGADFDNLAPWQRRRCILSHSGQVLAYCGEDGYTDSGFLTQAITPEGSMLTFNIGTPVNVMVEQQPYYYKFVPIKLEMVDDYHVIRKARYYISPTPKAGFELHPAFNGNANPIYLSAYESTLYNTVSEDYETYPGNYTSTEVDTTECTLSSIAGGNVLLSSRTMIGGASDMLPQAYYLHDEAALEMTQLLFLIEYASFNARQCIPMIDTPLGGTGATSSLGNASGSANGGVTYRGEEGLWGSYHYSCGATARNDIVGYISAYEYVKHSWSTNPILFAYPGECNGTSIAPVSDIVVQQGMGNSVYHGGNNVGLFALMYAGNACIYTRRFYYTTNTESEMRD